MTDIGSVLSSLVRRESFSNEGVEGALQGTVIGGGEIGGPTTVRISTVTHCFHWIYNPYSRIYTVIYTDKLILRARTHRNPLI